MNKVIVLPVILTFILSLSVIGQVKFIDTDFDGAKKMAAKQNKLIFIDAYTDWCGWCKKMDKETFSDSLVGKFMNDHFIPVKINMEQGYGKKIAMKFHVKNFPYYIFLNSDGILVYSSMGYSVPEKFIGTLEESLDPSRQIKAKGVSNIIDLPFPEFYQLQFEPKGIRKTADSATVNGYLEKQGDFLSEVNWAIIYFYTVNDKYNRFFLDNIDTYRELYGNYEPNQKLYTLYFKELQAAIKAKDEKQLEEVIDFIGRYSNENTEREKLYYRILFYKEMKDWKNLADYLNKMIDISGYEYIGMINEYAWGIYRFCDDAEIVKTAISWMKNVVEKEPKYAYLDTYASLLYKDRRYEEAEKYALLAIEDGKKNNEKIKNTEDLLQKIKDAKASDIK